MYEQKMAETRRRIYYYKLLFILGVTFILFSFAYNYFLTASEPTKRAAHKLTNFIENENDAIRQIVSDSNLSSVLTNKSLLFQTLDTKTENRHFSIFIYNPDQQVVYWSNNKSSPVNIDISTFGKEEKLVKINNGYLIMQVYALANGYHLASLIPIYKNYPVENKFLHSGFKVHTNQLINEKITSKGDPSNTQVSPVFNREGKVLFYVQESSPKKKLVWWPIVLIETLGVFFIFLTCNRNLHFALNQKEYTKGFGITLGYALFIQLYINELHIPTFTEIGGLFDVNSYASPFLAASIGALLFKIHLIHWALRHWLKHFLGLNDDFSLKVRNYLVPFYLVFTFYFVIFIISSLHKNSIISFDLDKYDQLELGSFVGILIISFTLGMMYIPVKFLRKRDFGKASILVQIVTSGLMIAIGVIFGVFSEVAAVCILVIVYILYQFILFKSIQVKSHSDRERFIYTLLIFSTYAFIGAICILYYSYQRKVEMLQHYAVELASERDYAEEFDLSSIVKEISEDNFIKNYFQNPYITPFDMDKRVKQRYFNRYLGKYNISVHSFNNEGTQLKGEGGKSYNSLREMSHQNGVQLISPGLYYLSVKPRGEKYMVSIKYQNEENVLGYLIVVFTPKTFTSFSAYPELLRSSQEYSLANRISDVSYAIYRNKKIIAVEGDYSYPSGFNFISPTMGTFATQVEQNYVHVIYRVEDRQVIVSYKRKGILNMLSYFSYLLIFQLLFLYILKIVVRYGSLGWIESKIRRDLRMNTLQKQIQTSMISQVLVSLLLIGAMTFFFFNVQYNHLHNESLKQRSHSIIDALETLYDENYVVHNEDAFARLLRTKVKQLSENYAIDINAYDLNGRLLYASQPDIFKSGLQSTLMNEEAYEALELKGLSSYIQDEWIGKLKYIAAYIPMHDPNGQVIGFINFPYYGKERNIKNDVSFFMMSLANIYAILIIIASFISLWVSTAIVKPLKIITESIKGVELGKKNAHISWKNKDEIGRLVGEYNRMIDMLEESAELLAKSEREGAWREMAKQVAHEIKNPLTPMKLSIQYLQRALKEDKSNVEELTQKTAIRLIEQIDTLANIATAFSDFAKMPVGKPEFVVLNKVIQSVVDIFENNQEATIRVNLSKEELIAYIDRDQISRVVTNLIKNAVQAIPENQKGDILVSLEKKGDHSLMTVQDNGIGIPKERAEDIFEPNFTTKSSGTGLGLAMSKSIVESAGGEIGFESDVEQGETRFFVKLKIRKNNE